MFEKKIFHLIKQVMQQNTQLKNINLYTIIPEQAKTFIIFVPQCVNKDYIEFSLHLYSDYQGLAEIISMKSELINNLENYHLSQKDFVFKCNSTQISPSFNKISNLLILEFNCKQFNRGE